MCSIEKETSMAESTTQAPDTQSKPVTARQSRRSFNIRTYFPILLFGVLCLIFGLASPRFFSFDNAMIVLQQAVVLLVTALGMTFVVVGGSIDLSVGSIVAMSALAAAVASHTMGIGAIIPAMLVGTLCGAVNGALFAKGKVPSFIATLGTMTVYRGIVLYWTRGAPEEITNELFLAVFSGRTMGVPNSALFALVIVIVTYIIFNNTVFGREVRAIGGGERVAVLTGIRVERVKLFMFVLLGLLAGLAGLLQGARVMAATAQLGIGLELDVIASVVVGGTPLTGGIGSIQGTILGVLIITVLSNGMNMMSVDPYLQSIVKGCVLVAAVFVTIDRTKIGIIK
jgi:ribose transport system permease protein